MEDNKKIGGLTWTIVIIAWAAYMLVNLGNFALGVMLPSMREELNFGVEAAGWLSASAWIFKAALTVPITLTIAKFKPKNLLAFVLELLRQGF